MPITSSPPRRGSRSASAPQKSNKGTLAAAGVAAVAAASLGVVALQGSSAPEPAATTAKVAVAQRAIPRGTDLSDAAANGAVRVERVPSAELRRGALTTAGGLDGKIAYADLKPGAQLTAASVGADTGALSSRLTAGQRAITIAIDAARGMAGDIRVSDRVDLYGSYQLTTKADSTPRPVVKLLAQDVRVLRVPAVSKKPREPSDLTQITVGLGPQTATKVAFTADNGKVWVAARPASGARSVAPRLVTLESLLFGVAPIIAIDTPKKETK